jgi:PAS domain S-box-containing protein
VVSETQPATNVGAVRSFVRQFRTEILAEWKRIARTIPAASDLSTITLTDHIPDLLEQVADIAEQLADDVITPRHLETARRHALDRLGAGFDVGAVVHELSMLRACMLAVWDREHHGREGHELRSLNLAFDRAIAESIARYVEAHDKTLTAIDTISTASLEAESLDDLLRRLLQVFLRTTASVDTAVIMLLEADGRLHTRAAVGLEKELELGYSVGKGEGVGGTVWAQGQPLELKAAFLDPVVRSQAIRDRGVRALYALPLVQAGRFIGVAHMGSLSANQFSQEDRQLFGSMAARATVGIYHHMLRDQLAASEARYKEVAAERERALGKLEALLTAAPIGIAFIDRDLRYLRINDALAKLNGRPAAEHIGRTVQDMLPEAAPTIVPLLRQIIATGEPLLNLEHVGQFAGSEHALLVNYFPVRAADGSVIAVGGVVIDVTEIRRVRESLRLSQQRLQSIIDYAPVAIFVKDAAGHIILTNEKTAQSLRRSRDDVLGHRGDELLPSEFEAKHRAHDLEVMRDHRVVEAEEVVPWDNGETRTFLTVKFPFDGEHGERLLCGISTDITERKRMEEQLRTAIRARDDVLATVSHDLRNPIATLKLAAAALAAHCSDRARKNLDMIERSTRRMERLIDDLLDASRIEHGQLRLELKAEPAAGVLGEAIELHEQLAVSHQLTLVRDDRVGSVAIACDRDRLLQVFGNIIGNAVKFSRTGNAIIVGAEPAGAHVRYFVTDTGPGIPSSSVPYLFEPFWSAPEHVHRGTGLGLYIARGIIEAHGGTISVESHVGEGTTISFTIPIAH